MINHYKEAKAESPWAEKLRVTYVEPGSFLAVWTGLFCHSGGLSSLGVGLAPNFANFHHISWSQDGTFIILSNHKEDFFLIWEQSQKPNPHVGPHLYIIVCANVPASHHKISLHTKSDFGAPANCILVAVHMLINQSCSKSTGLFSLACNLYTATLQFLYKMKHIYPELKWREQWQWYKREVCKKENVKASTFPFGIFFSLHLFK